MFANFIYFIVALLILSLYDPPEDLTLSLGQALTAFAALVLLYAIYVRSRFQRLLRSVDWESPARLDHQFTLLTTRCAILSLVLLAIDIWWLNMPAFLKTISWISVLPTLNSLIFLLIFVCYLTIMWVFSYDAHKAIYRTDIGRGNYVYSNIAFSVPVLIPWILLFGITDMVQLLPFELPKRILNDPMGQIVYFLIFLMVAAIFAPLLIQRFWRCKSMEAGPDRTRIEALCLRAGVRYADIVYWPIFGGRMITAAVMGLVARFRYILVTDALVNMLTPEEVDQVIAHEIGHVKCRHLLLYLLFFAGFMVISYAAYPVTGFLFAFSDSILRLVVLLDINPLKIHHVITAVFLLVAIVLYFRYIFGYFMRNFERQADVFVFNLFSTARPLISTFDKIVLSSGQPADKPNWHHFSIKQRIDYLWRCERFPEWIAKHNKKVNRSIIAYIAILIMLSTAVYQLNQMADIGEHHINVSDLEAYLDRKEDKTVDDGMLYWIIGNIYYDRQNLERAASAYETAILLNPKNPDALNNLAWLLVTSKLPNLHDRQKALQYAQRAISLKKAPHIWDTLAETLYANGRIAEAIDAENKALQTATEDRQIYEKQLERFKEALTRLQ